MIKARGTTPDGKPVYVLGLSAMNLKLLREGRPIDVDLSVLGGRGHVLLLGGETEEAIVQELRSCGLTFDAPPPEPERAPTLGERYGLLDETT